MAQKKHSVDIFTTNLRFGSHSVQTTFGDFLIGLDGVRQSMYGKDIEFELLENTEYYVVGILITTQKKDVPPKRNGRTGQFSALDLTNEEGLAYANILYYEKKHSILLYEFNKNGCYLEQFKDFLYRYLRSKYEPEILSVDIRFGRVLRQNEYRRAMDMRFYKSVEVEIAYPGEVINEFNAENGSIEEGIVAQLRSGIRNNAETVVLKQSVYRGNKIGLSHGTVHEFIDLMLARILTNTQKRKHLTKLEITGIPDDPDIKRQDPVDLVADVLRSEFMLDQPRLQADVQKLLRKGEIKALFQNLKPEFDVIFGK